MQDERRAVYRVSPGTEQPLRAVVEAASSTLVEAEVVDVGAGGARLRAVDGTVLTVGERVVLAIDLPAPAEQVAVSAAVASRVEADGADHYGLRFDAPRELPETLYGLFNRRGVYRAAVPTREEAATVVMRVPGAPEGAHVEGRLRDVSASGVGVIHHTTTGDPLDAVERVEVTLRLPGLTRALHLVAWIRNRESFAETMHYGLRFDPDAAPDFIASQEEILEYVLRRYEESIGGTR